MAKSRLSSRRLPQAGAVRTAMGDKPAHRAKARLKQRQRFALPVNNARYSANISPRPKVLKEALLAEIHMDSLLLPILPINKQEEPRVGKKRTRKSRSRR